MKRLHFLPLLALLPSCEVLPTARLADGSIITGGATFLTKSTAKAVNIEHPNGLKLNYATTGHDETVIPGKVVNYYGLKAAADAATSMLRTKESTTRILAKEETSRAATKTAAEVEKVKILNPVEEVIPAAVIPTPAAP